MTVKTLPVAQTFFVSPTFHGASNVLTCMDSGLYHVKDDPDSNGLYDRMYPQLLHPIAPEWRGQENLVDIFHQAMSGQNAGDVFIHKWTPCMNVTTKSGEATVALAKDGSSKLYGSRGLPQEYLGQLRLVWFSRSAWQKVVEQDIEPSKWPLYGYSSFSIGKLLKKSHRPLFNLLRAMERGALQLTMAAYGKRSGRAGIEVPISSSPMPLELPVLSTPVQAAVDAGSFQFTDRRTSTHRVRFMKGEEDLKWASSWVKPYMIFNGCVVGDQLAMTDIGNVRRRGHAYGHTKMLEGLGLLTGIGLTAAHREFVKQMGFTETTMEAGALQVIDQGPSLEGYTQSLFSRTFTAHLPKAKRPSRVIQRNL